MKQNPRINTKGNKFIYAALIAAAICIVAVFGLLQGGNAPSNTQPSSSGSSYTETIAASGASKPDFVTQDISELASLPDGYEAYSELDALGRCGVAVAKVGEETIPAKDAKRDGDSISKIHPSGWKQAFYPEIIEENDGVLYNRCHLVAYSLAAESGNELNLITGTAQMNDAMNEYEKQVKHYILDTGNHVAYRVTPDFQGSELVARGVRIEAFSIEDGGRGISIDAYIPNVQDGVEIDYKTGKSHLAE